MSYFLLNIKIYSEKKSSLIKCIIDIIINNIFIYIIYKNIISKFIRIIIIFILINFCNIYFF